jgi:uncharacterized protein YndB with AHSA1/START domain
MADGRFTYVIFIEATPERVWQALTDGEETRQFWAGRRVTSDWKPGATVHYYLEDTDDFEVSGRVLEHDPPRRLSLTWSGRNEGRSEDTAVIFEIQPVGGSVKLSLAHEPLADDAQARQGWAAILSSLKSFIETGRPLSATEMWRHAA